MKSNIFLSVLGAILVFVTSSPAFAQTRTGWGSQVDGLAVFQGNTDLSGGGDFMALAKVLGKNSAVRAFLLFRGSIDS